MYKCKACGYKGNKTNEQGGCIACDSFELVTLGNTTAAKIREREPKTMVEIFILIMVWGFLIYGLWDKFIR